MKAGKKMNQTITTIWKTALKCLFGGGQKEENGMICTVKTEMTGFVRFEKVNTKVKAKVTWQCCNFCKQTRMHVIKFHNLIK